MSDLNKLPTVNIDPKGVFKYVLIEASCGGNKKHLVWGNVQSEYHADVFDKCEEFLHKNKFNIKLKCLGGGRIKHDASQKHLHVYGHSVGFGKADHEISCSVLKEQYKDYKIDWDDEGY